MIVSCLSFFALSLITLSLMELQGIQQLKQGSGLVQLLVFFQFQLAIRSKAQVQFLAPGPATPVSLLSAQFDGINPIELC